MQPTAEDDYFEKPKHTRDVGARPKYEEGPWTVALTAVDKLQDTSTRKAALLRRRF